MGKLPNWVTCRLAEGNASGVTSIVVHVIFRLPSKDFKADKRPVSVSA